MSSVILANFLLHNLLQARMSFILLLHCWSRNETLEFAHEFYTPNQSIYMQYQNMKEIDDWRNFELRFMLHDRPTLVVYVDLECPQADDFMRECSRERLFNQHYHWLLHGTFTAGTFYDFFEGFNISVDADVTYVKQENATLFTLYDVYNNGNHIGGRLNVTADREVLCNEIDGGGGGGGGCHDANYLSSLHLRAKYSNRGPLSDVTFRISTVITKRPLTLPRQELMNFLREDNETHVDGLARFGFNLFMEFQALLGCKDLQFILMDRWSSDDTFGGSVGAVISELADIASTPLLPTEGRLRYLSAIVETGYFRSVCMFRTPRNAGIRGDVFLQPFSTLVWIIFAGVLVTIGILLWLTFDVERRRLDRPVEFVPSLLTTLLMSFGAACIQSSAIIPRSAGGRLTYFVLFLICFLLFNYYTSVVVSSLLSSPVKSDITTLKQLAESNLQVGFEPLVFTKGYLNGSQRPEVILLRKRTIEAQADNPYLWMPPEEGVLRVRDHPGYVFIFEASSGYAYVEKHYTPQEICDVNEVLFRPEILLYTLLHKNSTYKELIRLRTMRMLETGVIRKVRNYWLRLKLTCFATNYVVDVGMEYVAPLFFMLLLGYGLSLLLMLMEVVWHRHERRQQEREHLSNANKDDAYENIMQN